VLLAVGAVFYLVQPGANRFLTIDNWRVIAVNISTDALIVVGMTMIIIAGGFDLSVGSTVALGELSRASSWWVALRSRWQSPLVCLPARRWGPPTVLSSPKSR